jgi:hypothetical protein
MAVVSIAPLMNNVKVVPDRTMATCVHVLVEIWVVDTKFPVQLVPTKPIRFALNVIRHMYGIFSFVSAFPMMCLTVYPVGRGYIQKSIVKSDVKKPNILLVAFIWTHEMVPVSVGKLSDTPPNFDTSLEMRVSPEIVDGDAY